jgi:hypothetical protein
MMRSAALVGIAITFLLLATPGAAQNEVRYRVRLSPVPVDIPMRSTVAGIGNATAVLKGATLTVTGTFEGLVSPATTARVHRGVAMGVRGPSVTDLTVTKAPKGTVSGSINLSPEQMEGLKKGQFYIQISSEKAPDGNLWGWMVR